MEKINTVIFDMDGVILDSIPLHKETYQEIFEDMNIPFSIDKFNEINGMHIDDAFHYIKKNYGGNFDVEKAIEKKKQKNIEIAKNSNPQDDILELIEKLDGNYNLVLATSATKKEAEIVLDRFDLHKNFDCYVTGDDVKKSKPDPEIFEKCLTNIGVEKQNCMVIEDAPQGIEAAKNAGMKSIAITTTHDKDKLSNADYVVDHADKILKIINGGD